MKISKDKTEWLLVKANDNNEFHSEVKSCLIHLTEGLVEVIKERLGRVMDIDRNSDQFCGAEWIYWNVTYLTLDMEEDLECTDDMCYLELVESEQEAIETQYKPGELVYCKCMYISKHGVMNMTGIGKYSGIDIWTEDVVIENL